MESFIHHLYIYVLHACVYMHTQAYVRVKSEVIKMPYFINRYFRWWTSSVAGSEIQIEKITGKFIDARLSVFCRWIHLTSQLWKYILSLAHSLYHTQTHTASTKPILLILSLLANGRILILKRNSVPFLMNCLFCSVCLNGDMMKQRVVGVAWSGCGWT